jgi:hypothetical protein
MHSPPPPVQINLHKALAHPIRWRVLVALDGGRTASPVELADELGEGLALVSYHVRKLHELECLELVETRPVRGAVEHFYRAVVRPWYDDQVWSELTLAERWGISGAALDAIGQDIRSAASAGTIDSRPDRHISRSPLALDDEGWSELATRLDALLEDAQAIAAASLSRIAAGDTEPAPLRARLMMLLFEAAPDAEAFMPRP